jgi:hypothetical protein
LIFLLQQHVGKWTIFWQSFIAKGYLDSWMGCGTASPGFTSHCQDDLSGMKRQIFICPPNKATNQEKNDEQILSNIMDKYIWG